MILRKWLAAAALSASFALGVTLPATAAGKKTTEFTFGALRASSVEEAKSLSGAWLKTTGKMDQKAFDAIWTQDELTVLDRVAETFKLGSADAAKLLTESANAEKNAPKAVPAFLKNSPKDSFFHANLALAYARNLSSARVYEEALETLDSIKQPELVVDPAAYFFHKAVAEHALIKKEKAMKTIVRLLDDVQDAPDRYAMLSKIMFVDMLAWKADEKDLSNIVKLMDNSERRLDLSRSGKITQDIQKKIVFRLDELIKEKEAQAKSGGT